MADAQGSGGYSHMKKMRMLVISLRNVNCKFWSRDGKPTLLLPIQLSPKTVQKKLFITQAMRHHTVLNTVQ